MLSWQDRASDLKDSAGGTDSLANLPYNNTYSYNAFGHRTQSVVKNYGQSLTTSLTFTNNRRTVGTQDAEGNLLYDVAYKYYKYDAANRLVHSDFEYSDTESYTRQQEFQSYDGNGLLGKVKTEVQDEDEGPVIDGDTAHKIRSTVLGGVVVYDGAAQAVAYVYAGGDLIARHTLFGLMWSHKDPNMKTHRSTVSNGTVYGDGISGLDWDKIEADPDAKSAGFSDPGVTNTVDSNELYTSGWSFGSMKNGQYNTYVQDGLHVPQEYVMQRLNSASMGGALGLLFNSVREVGRWYRPVNTPDLPDNPSSDGTDGEIPQIRTVERLVGIEYETIWSPINLISSDDKTVELPGNFKDLLKARLNAKQHGQTLSCNDFISKLLAKVLESFRAKVLDMHKQAEAANQGNKPYSEYIPDATTGLGLLEKINKFTLVDRLLVGGQGAGGTVQGSIRGGDAEVLIQRKFYITPTVRGTEMPAMITNMYIGVAIHEMIHLAGNGVFSDPALAKAAFDLGYNKNSVPDPDTNDISKIFKYSGDWSDTLVKFCGSR